MTIFDFQNYKDFVVKRLKEMPKQGYGQFRKMAIFLSINSVSVTQIFKGDRHLTLEQACELREFFGLSELEGQYFVALVEKERAGSHKLKKMIQQRLDELKLKSQDLKQRLTQKMELTTDAKAHFYSNWFYSGIRLLSSVPGYDRPDTIAAYFGMSLTQTNQVLEFLVQHGLCLEEKGRFRMGPQSTHLEASSPLISRHHINWRLKAIEKLPAISGDELCLSMPCSLSPKALKEIRKEFVETIERVTKLIDEAPCEQLACLNIDLIKF